MNSPAEDPQLTDEQLVMCRHMARAICNAWGDGGCVMSEDQKAPCDFKNCSVMHVALNVLQQLGELE